MHRNDIVRVVNKCGWSCLPGLRSSAGNACEARMLTRRTTSLMRLRVIVRQSVIGIVTLFFDGMESVLGMAIPVTRCVTLVF